MSGNVHAGLMMMFAEDATKSEKPWLLWQSRTRGGSGFPPSPWKDLRSPMMWSKNQEYRRKPIGPRKCFVEFHANGEDKVGDAWGRPSFRNERTPMVELTSSVAQALKRAGIEPQVP